MYKALIVDTTTEEAREYSDQTGWDDVLEFMWSEGSYAADTNRHKFYNRSLGEPDPEPQTYDNTRFFVPYLIKQDGQLVYIDSDGA